FVFGAAKTGGSAACRSSSAASAAGSPGLARFVAGFDGGELGVGMEYLQTLPVRVKEFVQIVAGAICKTGSSLR
uniref:hypothetical protein n=3 Tax=Cupriavidus taiwanensis TaxID=164546 RepID=UPI001E2A0259